jgi:hypothetical protein
LDMCWTSLGHFWDGFGMSSGQFWDDFGMMLE